MDLQLPYEDHSIYIIESHPKIVLRSQLVTIEWTPSTSVVDVMVTNQLRNKVAGLCGNFNGSPLDDNLSRSKTPIIISGPTGANGLSALASSFHYTNDDTQVVVLYHLRDSCIT